MQNNTLAVIGGGAWGSSLAACLSGNFKNVTIYAKEETIINEINQQKTNTKYLPNITFSQNVQATSNLVQAIMADVVLIAVPTQYIGSVINNLTFLPTSVVLIASKGIEIASNNLISNIILQNNNIGKKQVGVLSGPTFASLIANNKISSFVVALPNLNSAKQTATLLANNVMRPYYSADVNGIQVLGAVKNIIAVASGIIAGANLGHNALSGLVSRSLKEISVLVKHYKGDLNSVFGLAGIGDLMLTTTSAESRNFSLGFLIGKNGGFSINLLNQLKGVPEGYYTAKAVNNIATTNNISMPICNAVYNICYNNATLTQEIQNLMSRTIKRDGDF